MSSPIPRFTSIVESKLDMLHQEITRLNNEIRATYFRDRTPPWLPNEIPYSTSALILWHEAFEAFVLLRLGIQLGLLDQDISPKYEPFIWPFLAEHRVARKELRQSFRSFLDEPLRSFPRWIPVEGLSTIANLERISLAFQQILLIECQMLEAPGIRVFLECLKYSSDDEWERLAKLGIKPEEIVNATESSDRTSPVIVYGFLRSIGCMYDIKGIVDSKYWFHFSREGGG
jgi:hypothetical protein